MNARTLVIVALSTLLGGCAATPKDADPARVPRAGRIMPIAADRPLIGIALGGGGARGFAHVGVIKALEKAGIVPDLVAGASSGAIVAALYAARRDARALEETALELEETALIDFTFFGRGWVQGVALQDFVNDAVGERRLEQLAIPLAVVATRARDGMRTVFTHGDTGLAVRASASVPNLFIPPVIAGEEYVDGGLTSPVPVTAARAMGADIVIAVDVSWFAYARQNGNAIGPSRSMRARLLERELAKADVVITPRTAQARLLAFDHKLENIDAGERAVQAALPKLQELLAAAQRRKAAARAPAAPATAAVD
ncbi:MAG TPA: patatin-like phospholipase family protein [Burkholderiales bacterium]|nr:patatin-like phospholipase family protein [Burkholderiales bacterium]